MPNAEELLERVHKLAPLLATHAAEAEATRRVPDEVIDALTEAGLFRLAVSARYGGYQADMRTVLEVTSALAEADGGTSWVVTLCTACAWLVGLFGERAQDDVFGADPLARVSGAIAPTAQSRWADGGQRITGRWYYNSGCWHADWAVLGVPIVDAEGEVVDQGLALVPRAEFTVDDTWFTAGMRSSGSACVVVDDVFVPSHRILSVPAAIEGRYATEHTEETCFRAAFVPVLALILVGPQLGLGRAARNHVTDRAGRRPISYTFFDKQVDSVGFQLQIAEAAQRIDTAHLHAYRAAADIDQAAARGEYPDYLTRARVRADTGLVAESVAAAIHTLLYAHGAGSFAENNPLQRIWRDANVAARHAIVLPEVGNEIYGKALLGIDEKITPLV